MESYDNKLNTAYKVTLEDVVNNKQTYLLSADNMVWDSLTSLWKFNNVRERKIIEQDRLDTLKNQKPIYKQIENYYANKESKIETKPYGELKDYIMREKIKGSNRTEFYEVEQYKRTSFPFATFILTIIGVCVSSRKVRGGVGLQIAFGMFLSCIYIMLMYVFTTIATTGVANALIAIWIPNIVFSFVALYFYLTAQK
jgi:lipopolysaccharide export system permease protein